MGQAEGIILTMPDEPVPQIPGSLGSASDPANNTAPAMRPARGLKPFVLGSLILAGVSTALSALALLFAAGVLPPAQDAVLERELRSYLLANPEVIVESISGLEARRQAAEENELTAILVQRRDEIINDPASPVGANPQGDVTLVEFFDYNCPYCRKATPMLDELEQTDKELRLVFKEYPILGPGSFFAARAALASQKQGKYLSFHKAMMSHKGQITENSSLEIAAQVGLDVERLKKDMEDPAIDEAIKRNLTLAEALRISGTPTFIAGKQVRPGLLDLDTMKQFIAEARKG